MLELPTTTLICVDCRDLTKTIKVMDKCKSLVNFRDVKLLTHLTTDYPHKVEIQNISSLTMYSVFMLKELYKYVKTEHLLVVQADGWILNPSTWDNDWLKYDYIGALFNQYDKVGNGGFSFRSRALMEFMSSIYGEWDGTEEGADRLQPSIELYEDGAISMSALDKVTKAGFVIAPPDVAGKFSQGGNPNNDYYYPHPFGFHGSWRAFNQETGFVEKEIKHDGFVPEVML